MFLCSYFEFWTVVLKEVILSGFFSIFSSGSHIFQQRKIICTIMVKGIMRNVCKKSIKTALVFQKRCCVIIYKGTILF